MKSRNIFLGLILCAAAVAPGFAQEGCEIGWSAPILISSDSSVSTLPEIAVGGEIIHLTWFGLDTTASGTLSQSGLRYARSTDGGGSFAPPVRLLSPFESLPGHIASTGHRVYITAGAILDTFFGTVLFVSDDDGGTWSPPLGVLSAAYPELCFTSGQDLYIGYREVESSEFGLMRSTNGGVTWTTVGRRLAEISDVVVSTGLFHAVGPTPGASQTEVGYSVSADSGTSWFSPVIISPEDQVRSSYPRIALNDRNHLFSSWIDTGAVVFRVTRNGGVSWGAWSRLSNEPGSVSVELDAKDEFVVAAWGREIGNTREIRVRVSNDRGVNFCPAAFPADGPAAREPALALADSTMHLAWVDEVGRGSGIYYRNGFLPRDTSGGNLPPGSFALKPSYPNPTNGFAYIGFDIPVAADAALTIYNVLGELVLTIGPKFYGPGRYLEPVDVGGLPSGVYFYRLITPGFATARKMVVLR